MRDSCKPGPAVDAVDADNVHVVSANNASTQTLETVPDDAQNVLAKIGLERCFDLGGYDSEDESHAEGESSSSSKLWD